MGFWKPHEVLDMLVLGNSDNFLLSDKLSVEYGILVDGLLCLLGLFASNIGQDWLEHFQSGYDIDHKV